jgi:hypothetical protein
MSAKTLTQHGGQAFTCDECGKVAAIASDTASAPAEWFSLQGFTEIPGRTLHACNTDCSAALRTKYKRIK